MFNDFGELVDDVISNLECSTIACYLITEFRRADLIQLVLFLSLPGSQSDVPRSFGAFVAT